MERTKYNVDKNVEKRTYDGIVFDSIMEMKFYRDVVLPQVESGEITHYELQREYILQPAFRNGNKSVKPIVYVADYYLEYADGRVEVIDIKGCPDSVAKLKRKMFWYVYPNLTYRWICYSQIDGNEENHGWVDYEYVNQQRKIRKLAKKKKELEETEDGK